MHDQLSFHVEVEEPQQPRQPGNVNSAGSAGGWTPHVVNNILDWPTDLVVIEVHVCNP